MADPCDDYARAVDTYIQAIRQSGQKLDQAADAHQFADAVTAFTSATEELTATLGDLASDYPVSKPWYRFSTHV